MQHDRTRQGLKGAVHRHTRFSKLTARACERAIEKAERRAGVRACRDA